MTSPEIDCAILKRSGREQASFRNVGPEKGFDYARVNGKG